MVWPRLRVTETLSTALISTGSEPNPPPSLNVTSMFFALQHDGRICRYRCLSPGRLSLKQGLCISLLWCRKNLPVSSGFDHFSLLHDDDPVGDPLYDVQIMGDENHSHAEAFLQIGKQFKDFRLYRHIKRRCRLICNQQLCFIGNCHGNHHTLSLPAGKFVRIRAQPSVPVREF